MLISEGYRALNIELHERTSYGSFGKKWASAVTKISYDFGISSILDYGCGKGSLKEELLKNGFSDIREYDPAIEGKDKIPEPADLVVCTDVLEHIEPDYINSVVESIKSKGIKCLFLVVSTRPAKKKLADGRNAHLIIQPLSKWLPLLSAGWEVIDYREFSGDFAILLRASSSISRWQKT